MPVKPPADVRFAGAPARVASSGVGWLAGSRFMLVAGVRPVGPVLQVRPAVAVLTASPKLRVEGVQSFDVEPGQR